MNNFMNYYKPANFIRPHHKIFPSLLLTAVFLSLLLTGCGSSDTNGTKSSSGLTSTGSSPAVDSKEEAAVSSSQDINEPWGTAGSGSGSNGGSKAGTSSFSQVIVDSEDLYFAITDATDDSVMGYIWNVSLENRTDQNLMYSMENVSVDGVMCDPYWAEVVSAGKSGNGQISWMRGSLAENGTEEVTEVEFTLSVYNDDDYTQSPLLHETYTVYPLGKEKASVVKRADKNSDEILIDNETCRILLTSCDPKNSWGYTVHLYLQNKTDEDLIFSAENVSLNFPVLVWICALPILASAQPIPMFLLEPPKPPIVCPLKCVRTNRES